MNFPGPVEFVYLLFLSFFFRWIVAALCLAAALFIRPVWWSMAAAALIALVNTAIDMGAALFFSGLTDFYNALFLLIPISAGLAWWLIGRAILLILRRIMPRFAS